MTLWHGLVPAHFRTGLGRAAAPPAGARACLCTSSGAASSAQYVSLFAASVLARALGEHIPGIQQDLGKIARWLMAWGDAVVTGMVAAVFVAYKPQWLATWSDELYLYRHPPRP